LEPINPAAPRQSAARPAPRGFGLSQAPALSLTAGACLTPLPAAQRHFRPEPVRYPSWQEPSLLHVMMPRLSPGPFMRIRLATPKDLGTILYLIDDAGDWLRSRPTDQWANPWPDREQRDARVLAGLENKKTWIIWDGDIPAATVTLASRRNPQVWVKGHCQVDLRQPAAYVHRLITARKYAGIGLGAQLIEWAGRRAHDMNGAKWIRIDVWTTNEALHRFYQKIGFTRCGECPDKSYPSGALFQKPVSTTGRNMPLFR
jgi:GNAT superfamily N-acetyltransferase